MKQVLLIWTLCAFGLPGFSQELPCPAQDMFSNPIQCNAEGEKCVQVSVAADSMGKAFTYEWELGDGVVKQGQQVEHCYASYGSYRISLNLIDPATGYRFENELERSIEVVGLESLTINTRAEYQQNTPVNFTYSNDMEGFTIKKSYWSLGEGSFSCDTNPVFEYQKSGKLEVKLLLRGIREGKDAEFCISKFIQVNEFILDGAKLVDIFQEKEQTLTDRGRFLNDEAHYIIYNRDDHSDFQLLDVEKSKYDVDIQPDTEYEMYAWKGNLFTPIQTISTHSLTVQEAKQKLKEGIESLFKEKPEGIDGFKFDPNVSTPPVKKLEAMAELMKTYSHISLAIGVYTHTGGRLEKNINLSKKRAELIRQELINLDIAGERLQVVSAREEHDLLNTCYGTDNCDIEDESLNRKAEFKIIGVTANAL